MGKASRREWLASEGFELFLGAGFFGFFAHTGLLAALEEADLRPTRIVGVSAGALAGGLWASGLGAVEIEHALCTLRREEFWDPGFPWGGLLRGARFADKLRAVLGPTRVTDIEDCSIPFVAVAHDVLRHRPRPIERGPVGPAILASCAVPLMFRPVRVGRALLVDGGVSDRHGLSAMRGPTRALVHFLPSRGWVRRSADVVAPRQPHLMTLCSSELPRVHPYALHRGRLALELTRQRARDWLSGVPEAGTR